MNKDLEFLAKLNKKLHKVEEGTFTPNMGGSPFPIQWDSYTDKKMNKEEIEKVLKISKGLNFVICPFNTDMGFSVGYGVYQINPIGKKKRLLAFKESQLPKEYNFKKMSEIFASKTNLTKAKITNLKIVNNYEHYTY